MAASVSGAVLNGPVTNPANGHQYYLLSPNTWTEAEAEANTLGGHLVTIDDAAENDWVATTFGTWNNLQWIGLNDAVTEGAFVWSSGDPSTYRNWYAGHPGGGSDAWDYVVLLTDQTHKWLVYPPNASLRGIVEVVPEPSLTVAGLGLLTIVIRRPRRREQSFVGPATSAE